MKRLSWMILAVAAMVMAGCKCPCSDESTTLGEGVALPKGYSVVKGLGEADFDDAGWPKYIVCDRDGSTMTLVNAGAFSMGSKAEADEGPVHRVAVDRYYIDVYEVSNVQFGRFIGDAMKIAGNLKTFPMHNRYNFNDALVKPVTFPARWLTTSLDSPVLADQLLPADSGSAIARNWAYTQGDCTTSLSSSYYHNPTMELGYFNDYWTAGVNDNAAARAVNFWEAWYYCRWLGKDLPTEAEWELAAKGPSDNLYPWGNVEPDAQRLLCNLGGVKPSEDGYEYVAPVSAFGAGRSPFGCYNMAGNVAEWCKDRFDASIYGSARFARGEDRKAEQERLGTNPTGSKAGDQRAVRGGSFADEIYNCRTTARRGLMPNDHDMRVGFRGVLRVQ